MLHLLIANLIFYRLCAASWQSCNIVLNILINNVMSHAIQLRFIMCGAYVRESPALIRVNVLFMSQYDEARVACD